MPQLDTATLQKVFDDYRTRKITSDQFMAAVKTLYKESGFDDAQAASLTNNYLSYARTGKSLNSPALAPFNNPLQPMSQETGGGGLLAKPQPMGLSAGQEGFLQENPSAEWNRAFSLPSVGGNPFQKWLGGQADPAYSSFLAKQGLDTPTGGGTERFGQYLGAQGEGLSKAFQDALGSVKRAGSLASDPQTEWLDTFRRTRAEGGGGGNLSDLFQAALRGRGVASPVARAYAGNLPGYEQQWNTETLGGNNPGSQTLMEYLLKKLGMGG